MPINKEKLKALLQAKQNPTLALFQSLSRFEKELAQYKESTLKSLQEAIRAIINGELIAWTEKNKANTDILEEVVEKAVSGQIFNKIQQIKGEKGEKGDKGDKGDMGLQGPKGERGPEGLAGASGRDGKDGSDGKDGKNGIDGQFPQKGINYFTLKEQQEFMKEIKSSLEFDKLIKKIEELAELFKNLQTEQKLGRKTLHRGGVDMNWEVPSGTCNGSNTTFTLASSPYSSDMVMFFVNGQLMKKDSDYTISGATITTLTAPPSGSVVWALYRKA